MRLLVVMNYFQSPARSGSSLLAENVLQLLAQDHEIHLICQSTDSQEGVSSLGLASVTVCCGGRMGRLKTLRARVSRQIRGARLEVEERISSALASGRFDAIVLFEMSAIQFVDKRWRPITVANIEDPTSIKLWRLSRLENIASLMRLRLLAEACLSYVEETRALGTLGATLLLSAEDAAAIATLHSLHNVDVMGYGVSLPPSSSLLNWEQRSRASIVITGNMYHPPNVDGIVWFLSSVFGNVLSQMPHARLLLVGARPDERIVAAAGRFGDSVHITGHVPDVAPYIREAAVSVCPVRLRIGVQTKVLEAMSWGTPVVSTPEGNSGIRGKPGEHLLVAESNSDFARMVVDVASGKDWSRLSVSGRQLAENQFSWKSSAQALVQSINKVVWRRRDNATSPES